MKFMPYVKIREEKFGSVIFETLKEKVYVTNETGKDILTLLKDGNSPEEIVAVLSDEYNEDRTLVEEHVKDFIGRLLKNRLINGADSD